MVHLLLLILLILLNLLATLSSSLLYRILSLGLFNLTMSLVLGLLALLSLQILILDSINGGDAKLKI